LADNTQDALLLKRRARRRLVGAIALVLFVVIVLPIVLDQEPRSTRHDLTVQIPNQDAGTFGSRVLPKLPAPKAAESGTAAPAPAPTATEATKPEPKASAPAASAGNKPAPRGAAKEPAKKAETSDGRRALALLNDESFVVPLGTFASPDNAKQAQDKASAAGFKTYTEKIAGKDGEQTRVRAGPFETRESAEKAREKLKALGLPVGQVAQR
jgi:DedD protein